MPTPWFELIHDLEFPHEYSETDVAFLEGLREAARGWDVPPAHSWAWRVWGEPPLVAAVELSDPEAAVALGVFGVHLFSPYRVRGDELHNQTFHLPESPTGLALAVNGSPEEVVARCAEWFEGILRKPVVRYEWVHRRKVYARRWLFADTGEGLVQTYSRPDAPLGQTAKLIAAGHVYGRGWIQTSGLGNPDRTIPVRRPTR